MQKDKLIKYEYYHLIFIIFEINLIEVWFTKDLDLINFILKD